MLWLLCGIGCGLVDLLGIDNGMESLLPHGMQCLYNDVVAGGGGGRWRGRYSGSSITVVMVTVGSRDDENVGCGM